MVSLSPVKWLYPIFPKVVLVAVVLHAWLYADALMRHSYIANDSVQYLTLADNLAEHGVWSQSYTAPFMPDAQRTPGYPVLMILLGRMPWLILLMQHIAVLAAAGLLYRVAQKTFSVKVAKWVTGIWLLQPYPLVMCSVLLSEPFFLFAMLLSLYLLVRWKDERRLRTLAGGITSLVAAALLRPVAYPVVLLAVLLLMWLILRKKERMVPQFAVVMLIPLCCLGGWMLRNHAVTGRYTFNTMGDMGMIHGRLGGIETVRRGEAWDEHHLFMAGDSIIASEVGLPNLKYSYCEVQNHETELYTRGLTGFTLRYFLQHPQEAVVYQTRAVVQMLTGTGYGWVRMVTGNRIVSLLMAGWQVLCNLMMYICFLLAFWRATKWPLSLRMAVVGAVVMLAISAVAWSDGRYRMVADPALMLCVGWVLQRRADRRNAPAVAEEEEA